MDGWIDVLFYALFLAAAVFTVKKIFKFLTAQIDVAQSDMQIKKKELARIGLAVARNAIVTVTEAVVGKLEQIKATDLRQMVKDGDAHPEELKALAVEAYEEIVKTVNPELLEIFSESVQDVGQYIRNQIEGQLLLWKNAVNGRG